MKTNIPLYTSALCMLIRNYASKPKQAETPRAPEKNAVGINDTPGLSLHPEYPVYSTEPAQVTFVFHNDSGTDIGVGGSYSCTYEDEKGICRDLPVQLIVCMEEYLYHPQGDALSPTKAVTGSFKVFDVVDKMPEFPEGIEALPKIINDNIQFIVDENGFIIEPHILKGVEPSLDKEVLRIIRMFPRWKSGTLKGKAVKVKYTVPVVFKFNR